ncbi:LPS export ABC transporter permease LptG [Candidatus Rariloculus sp.]|uniref:LPS export ABC transporter permease LptG n=1 Tax=Candidatus Rariloculus sp. TaxID=3101265 RepID=UPI003D10C4CB
MRLLRAYIVVAILQGVALVLAVLVCVGAFIEFVGQLDDVGVANYGLAEVATYVALRIPRLIVEVLPIAALLGALLSLGNLAVHRELVVMRASGISQMGLLSAVAFAGFMLLVVMVLLGESLAPSLGAYAREMRTRALLDDVGLAAGESTWLKDGDRIINLRRPAGGPSFGREVFLFDLAEDGTLQQVARADSTDIDLDNQLVLVNYQETAFSPEGMTVRRERDARRNFSLSPDLLGLSIVREDLLDTRSLERYIGYLRDNELDADRYLVAYWARIANAVSVVLMTVLALPFVFGGLRSAGAGARLVVGLVIGLSYYGLGEVFANSGEVFDLDPLLVAWTPSALLFLVTLGALVRVR